MERHDFSVTVEPVTRGEWQFWIDRGGTFTDVVALCPDGRLETQKLLSENPDQYRDAAAEAIHRSLMRWSASGGATAPVEAVKMGTTVATNALLERQGSPTVLVVTQGFGDALAIGYQNRPDIFALDIQKPAPLYTRVLEASERIDVHGEILKALDEKAIRTALKSCVEAGMTSVAICLVHGYRHAVHEKKIALLARQVGFEQISTSHEVEPLVKFVSRAETTLADAYLTPVLDNYIESLREALHEGETPRRLLFMQSSGGLVLAQNFRGKDSVLSGPAGGVVGMVETASSAGFERLIGFDMGGTSTDVSAFSGEYERSDDSMVGGVRLRAPMMKIYTIAAGGGSQLRYRDERYQVGPDSAGSEPGPACYRRGGPLCVTDANVLLGRIPAEHFPRVFGPGADQPLDAEAVRAKFTELANTISREQAETIAPEEVAAGFITVAIESMANAIRKITVERGEDVRDFTLCCFGGAGGQHACRVAEVLGIQKIWLHPMAGVLSAYGMGLSNLRVERQHSIDRPFDEAERPALVEEIDSLRRSCDESLAAQNVPADHRTFKTSVGLRIRGGDTILYVEHAEFGAMTEAFRTAYRDRFGAEADAGQLVMATLRVEATGHEQRFRDPEIEAMSEAPGATQDRMWIEDGWRTVPVYERSQLGSGFSLEGPAIVAETNGTTVVDEGWSASVNDRGHLLLTRTASSKRDTREASGEPDPVRLEVFNRLFMNIAEQMGTVLQKTALSVNIRERLDFSCALFDAEGRLVSNAPHMPVHLGSMGESVRSVLKERGNALQPGDAVMLNSPYNGGTHLPDITVVTPWFGDSPKPLFFIASRAHHADVGGITPGSMPSESHHIEEEGVLIDNFWLVRGGELQTDSVLRLLREATYPARNTAQNIADLKAQLAANQQGIHQLERAVERYGMSTVQNYLKFVRENAEKSVRRLLGSLRDGEFETELDSGEVIRVRIEVDRKSRTASIDFSGTSQQSRTNFNAPEAVTRAAVLYVFRSLIREEIPMNEGCLEPLEISIPKQSLLSPLHPAAVVAGNVETSQCVTDTLYGALGALSASQGTMNNLSFGNDRVQYYETICGGSGAGPGWHGTDAVHTHMTNSRSTDPEVFEQNFPVLVESFSIRKNSGGNGHFRGGNGAIRHLRFLEPVEVSILSNRRIVPPFGLEGGEPGQTGNNRVLRAHGGIEALGGTASLRLEANDSIVIETPGGGGFGKPD